MTAIAREGLEERAREVHRARLSSLLPGAFDPSNGFDQEHEEEVVKRVVAAVEKADDPPFVHEHAYEETGLCTECDAGIVFQRLEDGE